MATDQLDRIEQALRDHGRASERRATEIHQRINELDRTVAKKTSAHETRLNEHEKRMDRADRRAAGISAASGGGLAAVILAIKHVLGIEP